MAARRTSGLEIPVSSDTRRAERNLRAFNRTLDNSRQFAERAAIAVASVGVGVGAAAVASAVRLGSTLVENARNVGLSVEAYQEWQRVVEGNGLTSRQFRTAITALTRRIGEAAAGNEAYAATFRELGIRVRDAFGNIRGTEAVLDDIADAIQRIPDAATRLRVLDRLGSEVFRRFSDTLSVGSEGIRRLREEFRDLGIIISGDESRRLKEFGQIVENIGNIIQITFARAVASTTPELREMTSRLQELGSGPLQRTADSIALLIRTFAELTRTYAEHAGTFQAIIGLYVASRFAPALRNTASLGRSLVSTFGEVGTALTGYRNSLREVRRAQGRFTSSTFNMNRVTDMLIGGQERLRRPIDQNLQLFRLYARDNERATAALAANAQAARAFRASLVTLGRGLLRTIGALGQILAIGYLVVEVFLAIRRASRRTIQPINDFNDALENTRSQLRDYADNLRSAENAQERLRQKSAELAAQLAREEFPRAAQQLREAENALQVAITNRDNALRLALNPIPGRPALVGTEEQERALASAQRRLQEAQAAYDRLAVGLSNLGEEYVTAGESAEDFGNIVAGTLPTIEQLLRNYERVGEELADFFQRSFGETAFRRRFDIPLQLFSAESVDGAASLTAEEFAAAFEERLASRPIPEPFIARWLAPYSAAVNALRFPEVPEGDQEAISNIFSAFNQVPDFQVNRWYEALNGVGRIGQDVFDGINASLEQVIINSDGWADRLEKLATIIATRFATSAITNFVLPLLGLPIPGRQFGGPVRRDRPYLVGESGPEIFVPDRPGRIDPNIGGGATFAPQVSVVYAPTGGGNPDLEYQRFRGRFANDLNDALRGYSRNFDRYQRKGV